MEQYFTVVSKSSALRKRTDEKQHVQTTKYHPYKRQPAQGKQDDKEVLSLADSKPSTSAITKFLLATLADQSNPITHSDIGERSGNYRLI